MSYRTNLSLLLVVLLVILPGAASSQIDPGVMPVRIVEILDPTGARLGMIVVVGRSGRGFETGREYWSFSQEALLEIEDQESIEFSNLAAGEWTDRWIAEALEWQPEDRAITWTHPVAAEWIGQDEMLPPIVPGGAYFGHPTLGGLTIQYSERGPASLTWFKLTEGDFMQLDDGALFTQDNQSPSTGSWWQGSIDPR